MGNPPKPGDQCEAFEEKRSTALSGKSDDMLYVELGADRNCDPDDRSAWAKANPSYRNAPASRRYCACAISLPRIRSAVGGLGIWDETAAAYAISPDLWKAAAIDDVPDGGTVSFGIDMPPDRSVLTIGAALR